MRNWGNPEAREAYWEAEFLKRLRLECFRILAREVVEELGDFSRTYDPSFAQQQNCARTAIKAAMEISPLLPQ